MSSGLLAKVLLVRKGCEMPTYLSTSSTFLAVRRIMISKVGGKYHAE